LYLGTEYSNDEIASVLKQFDFSYEFVADEKELLKKTALLLSKNKVVGWFQERMEYGPRALGARSILANPKKKEMKEIVNKIKIRELFRPFAGSILTEHAEKYFELPQKSYFSPFMVFCFKVREEMRKNMASIVHEDFTCRIHTVSKEDGKYYKLIKNFYDITGIPILLNTSFNLKGEPIVETPLQAVNDFVKTSLDYLIIGSYIVSKK